MRRKIFAVFLSVIIVSAIIPAAVYADAPKDKSTNTAVAEKSLKMIADQVGDPMSDPFDYAANSKKLPDNYPDKYDLRDLGLVTPVKFQNPFGTCWGFAAIAAAEISILGSADPAVRGDFTAETLDLSEKHLTYFIAQAIEDPTSSQYGEGTHVDEGVSVADKLNYGGLTFLATNLFASRVGPVIEDDGSADPTMRYMGKEGSVEYRMIDGKLTEYCYDDEDDWSLPEEYRFLHNFELKESYILPSPAKSDPLTGDYEYNPEGTKAIKEMLMNNRAVQIGFCADTSLPSQESGDGQYISTNWAHYTYDATEAANHCVTIVGWDDSYPATNFIEGHQPRENGAWLVKNSWGSEEETFPNRGPGWGIENEKGEHTGYFWLSYYDKTLDSPEALEFDRNNTTENEGFYVDEYDFMPPNDVEGAVLEEETKMANVFRAQGCELLEGVSCQTSYPGTKVKSEIYLLPNAFSDPTDGLLVSSAEGEYEFGGFHKMTLKSPVTIQKGQYYSIVQTQTVPDGEYAVNMPVALNETFVKATGEKRWVEGVVNERESYMYAGGKWNDYADEEFAQKLFGDMSMMITYDNFPIKGYCRMKSPEISIRVSGDTELDIYEKNTSDLRVSFKGTGGSGAAVPDPKISWELSEGGEKYFTLTPDSGNPSHARVTAKGIGHANLYITVTGVGTTVVPLSVSKIQLGGYALDEHYYVYNGKAQTPEVIITDTADNEVDPKHYVLKYSDNTKCGLAKIIAEAKPDDPLYQGSQEVTFMIIPAGADIISMTDGKQKLTVTVKDQKTSGISAYEVSYRLKGDPQWSTKSFSPASNTLVLEPLTNGRQYEVKVRAKGAYDEDYCTDTFGEYSAVKTSVKIGELPATPKIRRLKAGKGKVTIRLKGKRPADVTTYNVRYRIKGTKKWKMKTLEASGNKLILKKLKSGKKYQITVRAVKANGLHSKYSRIKTSGKIK